MIVAIADTHAVIWYLFSDSRLGAAASAFIEQTIAAGDHIGVSAITIAEMVYLVEKGRISAGTLNDLRAATADPATVLHHVPFDENIAIKMTEIPRHELPDLPDRVIRAKRGQTERSPRVNVNLLLEAHRNNALYRLRSVCHRFSTSSGIRMLFMATPPTV